MAFHLSKNRFLNSNSMTSSFQIARIYTSSVTFLGKPHRRTSLTATGAQKFVKDLNEEERTLLMTALSKRNNFLAMQAGLPLVQQPSIQELYKLGKKKFFIGYWHFYQLPGFFMHYYKHQLINLGLHQSLPFVGFGFLDNLIMIVAGEYIDASIGLYKTLDWILAKITNK